MKLSLTRFCFLSLCGAQPLFLASTVQPHASFTVLDPADYAEVLGDDFNWALDNIPFVDVDDADVQLAYYFRWRSYRMHIKPVTDASSGPWIVDEFLPNVGWAGKDNTISCAAGHHFMEGRWLRNHSFLDSYAKFWFRGGGSPRLYTFWSAWAYYSRYLVTGDADFLLDLYPDLKLNYDAWKASHYSAQYGCMWQYSDRDGQENSIGGDGCRPVLNSVMHGEAKALAAMAKLVGNLTEEAQYEHEAEQWRQVVLGKLWSEELGFFVTLNVPKPTHLSASSPPSNYKPSSFNTFCCDQSPCVDGHSSFLYQGDLGSDACFEKCESFAGRCEFVTTSEAGYCLVAQYCNTTGAFVAGSAETYHRTGPAPPSPPSPPSPPTPAPVQDCRPNIGELAGVREIQGLSSPWYFGVPPKDNTSTYVNAWSQLFDTDGLAAKWGPRTAERRSTCYNYTVGHECNWNGPSWPFETSKVITGAANLLNDYSQSVVTVQQYLELLQQYARAHTRMAAVNSAAWLLPGTGTSWIGEDFHPDHGYWLARQIMYDGGDSTKDRGNNYNHSTFCDLVLSGLFGIRPGLDGSLTVNPLIPENSFKYFAVDGVQVRGRSIAIAFDADGSRYNRGSGLQVWIDGELVASAPTVQKLVVQL